MASPIPSRIRPVADVPAWGEQGFEEDTKGLRGVIDDLRVLFALMLGQDMVPRQIRALKAAIPQDPPPSRR